MGEDFLDLGRAVSGAANAFTADLYKALRRSEGSLLLSPFSVWTCLAMAFAGARGNTAAQMTDVLGLPAEYPDVHETIGKVLAGLDRQSDRRMSNTPPNTSVFSSSPTALS
jgi:serpin B